MAKKKVLVGMSGGIDSSAVCLMLQEQGYDVAGITMRVWDLPRQFSTEGQTLPDFILEARQLADRLGIPHYVADEREAFHATVVRNFIDEYLGGRTPNPCVMCNPLFKFRVLTEWADRLGCEFIATGHYVRLGQMNERPTVCCGVDRLKDQSYFLWRLSSNVLRRCLFPLGGMHKADVRAYLDHKGFALKAREGESMEVCFIDGDYRDFLRNEVPDIDTRIVPGRFVDAEGHVLGVHEGYAYYTIGQRRGLGIALGKPAFVLKINPERNTVMLGDAAQLETRAFLLERAQIHHEESLADSRLTVRIRYHSSPVPCRVKRVNNRFPLNDEEKELLLVEVNDPVAAVTPGQSAVFYIEDQLVGGAYIARQRGVAAYI